MYIYLGAILAGEFCRPVVPTTVKGSGPSTLPLPASGYNVVYKAGADPNGF